MGFKLGKMLTLTYTKRNQIKTIVIGVQTLGGKLRSHKLCSVAENKEVHNDIPFFKP